MTLVFMKVAFWKFFSLCYFISMYKVSLDDATRYWRSLDTLNAKIRLHQLSYADTLFRAKGFHFEKKLMSCAHIRSCLKAES